MSSASVWPPAFPHSARTHPLAPLALGLQAFLGSSVSAKKAVRGTSVKVRGWHWC